MKRQGLIKVLSASKIIAGQEEERELEQLLDAAQIIVLLVSGYFLADYDCEIQVKRAMERYKEQNTIVIPIILRPCDWKNTPFGKLKPTNCIPITSCKNLDEAFLSVAEGIRTVVKRLTDSSS